MLVMVARRSLTKTELARSAKLKADSERLMKENRILRESLRAVREQLRVERAKARTVSRVLNPHLAPEPKKAKAERRERRDVGLIFLQAELQLSRTFLAIAADATDANKRSRNIQNARLAYESLHKFYRKTLLTRKTAQELDQGIADIRKALQKFGEDV